MIAGAAEFSGLPEALQAQRESGEPRSGKQACHATGKGVSVIARRA